jgi:hypothetical protein
MSGEVTEPTRSGWNAQTTFSALDLDALHALAAIRGGQPKVFGHVKAEQVYDSHACGGEIYTDLYFDEADGHIHAGVSIWYPCEHYLEILGDVVVA